MSSPFLAETKEPLVPHILEPAKRDNGSQKKNKKPKRKVVINIINNADVNDTFSIPDIFDQDFTESLKGTRSVNSGLDGIMVPLEELGHVKEFSNFYYGVPQRQKRFKRSEEDNKTKFNLKIRNTTESLIGNIPIFSANMSNLQRLHIQGEEKHEVEDKTLLNNTSTIHNKTINSNETAHTKETLKENVKQDEEFLISKEEEVLSRTALEDDWSYIEENEKLKSEGSSEFIPKIQISSKLRRKKVNGTQRNSNNYYQNAYQNYPPGYYENSQSYPYYSPPDGAPNSIQDKLTNNYDYYEDYPTYQEPVDPSQLLIGVGGIRSTTRIPFIKKPGTQGQTSQQQMIEVGQQPVINQVGSGNNNNNKQQVQQEDTSQIFGDLSNLINLSNGLELTQQQIRPSSGSNAPPNRIQVLNDGDRTVITSGPGFQSVSRPGGQTTSTFPVNNIYQEPGGQPLQRYPQRRPNNSQRRPNNSQRRPSNSQRRPQRPQRPVSIPERNTYDYYDYKDYTEYDYNDYFVSENSEPIGPVNRPNRPNNRNPIRQQSTDTIYSEGNKPPSQYPQYPPQNYPQYPQYPRYPYAPQYPYYYPYPPPPKYNPASTSTSVSCNSGGCASAASATAGSSSSSSTSTTVGGGGGGGGGGGSSAASGGNGGASTSTSGRSNKIPNIISAADFEEWNSFEPISKTDRIIEDNSSPQEGENTEGISKAPHMKSENSGLLRSLLPRLPLPGIIQPRLERRKRSPADYYDKPVLRVPAYLAGLENGAGNTQISNIPVLDPEDVIWNENVIEDEIKRKVESMKAEPLDAVESTEDSNSILNNLVQFMDDDLEVLMDNLESSDDPVIMYMNNRVDDIMHGVHAGMEHPGKKVFSKEEYSIMFISTVMGEFVRMMLAVPVVGLALNLIGAPPGATAFLGMVVPMFFMQYIGPEEGGHSSHHHG